MNETDNNRRAKLGVKHFAIIFISVCTSFFVILPIIGANQFGKIAQSKRITTKELQKIDPEKQIEGINPGQVKRGLIKISAALTVEPYVIKAKDPESKASGFEVEIENGTHPIH